MNADRVGNWYDQNWERHLAWALIQGIKYEAALDLVQEAALRVLAALQGGRVANPDDLRAFGNGVFQTVIQEYRRYGWRRRNLDLPLPLDVLEKVDSDEADPDDILNCSDPVSVAAAHLDRDTATPKRREFILAALRHEGEREGIARTTRVSDAHLRENIRRVGAWLAAAPKHDPFDDAKHRFGSMRPLLQQTIETYKSILRTVDWGQSDRSAISRAHRRWEAEATRAASEAGAFAESVQFYLDVTRVRSPRFWGSSPGRVVFHLGLVGRRSRLEAHDFEGVMEAFARASECADVGDDSGTTHFLARAWREALALKHRDTLEEFAIRSLRRRALEGIVWRLWKGDVSEEDMAPLVS